MKVITTSHWIDDHHRFFVHIGKSFEHSEGTCFVMGKDIALQDSHGALYFNGTLACRLSGAKSFSSVSPLVAIVCPGYKMSFRVSEVESGKIGALSYIDHCSNTVLISPDRDGDPCINYLYFSPQTVQKQHTHPSARIGLILSGSGHAIDSVGQKLSLEPGLAFYLPRHEEHSFNTVDSSLSLMVFHPDSSGGPQDQFNPMWNRTYTIHRG